MEYLIGAGLLLLGLAGGMAIRRLSYFDRVEQERDRFKQSAAYKPHRNAAARQMTMLHVDETRRGLEYIKAHAESILSEVTGALQEMDEAQRVLDADQRGEYDPDAARVTYCGKE